MHWVHGWKLEYFTVAFSNKRTENFFLLDRYCAKSKSVLFPFLWQKFFLFPNIIKWGFSIVTHIIQNIFQYFRINFHFFVTDFLIFCTKIWILVCWIGWLVCLIKICRIFLCLRCKLFNLASKATCKNTSYVRSWEIFFSIRGFSWYDDLKRANKIPARCSFGLCQLSSIGLWVFAR